jgi:hypothetical protein
MGSMVRNEILFVCKLSEFIFVRGCGSAKCFILNEGQNGYHDIQLKWN